MKLIFLEKTVLRKQFWRYFFFVEVILKNLSLLRASLLRVQLVASLDMFWSFIKFFGGPKFKNFFQGAF